MGIFVKGRKEVVAVTAFEKVLSAIYSGAQLVWQAIRSCFGAGRWINDKPWRNEEGWRNE